MCYFSKTEDECNTRNYEYCLLVKQGTVETHVVASRTNGWVKQYRMFLSSGEPCLRSRDCMSNQCKESDGSDGDMFLTKSRSKKAFVYKDR